MAYGSRRAAGALGAVTSRRRRGRRQAEGGGCGLRWSSGSTARSTGAPSGEDVREQRIVRAFRRMRCEVYFQCVESGGSRTVGPLSSRFKHWKLLRASPASLETTARVLARLILAGGGDLLKSATFPRMVQVIRKVPFGVCLHAGPSRVIHLGIFSSPLSPEG